MKAQRLEIDFGRSRPPMRAAAWLLVTTGIVVAVGSAWGLARAVDRSLELQAERTQLEVPVSKPAKATGKALADPRLAARIKAADAAAQSLQRPWDELLEAVEQRPAGDVALLAVEPSAQRQSVRITAEARTEQAMLQHLALLQQDGRLHDVALVSHQRQLQVPGTPWRYQIQGSW